MSELEKICAEVLDTEEKIYGRYVLIGDIDEDEKQTDLLNARLISWQRVAMANAPKLARACLEMKTALLSLRDDISIDSDGCDCPEIAKAAIEKIEEILK